jgi:arylsulfatase A-like enzyme
MRTSLLALPLLLASSAPMAAQEPAKPERPNILLIFTDDHAWQAVSAYSDHLMQTPNLDRIADEGIRFDRALVPNPISGPSRACVLTGKYSHKNGYYRNATRQPFDGSQWTFPKSLQAAGYETALIGKWHLGDQQAPQGFHYSAVLIGQGPYYNPRILVDPNGDGNRHEETVTGYTTDIVTDWALEWLDERQKSGDERPFLLMLQHKAPHRAWDPAPRHLADFEDVTYPEPPTLFSNHEGMPRAARQADMRISETLVDRDLKLMDIPGLTDEQRAVWDAYYKPRNAAFKEMNLTGDDLVRWKYQRYIRDYLKCVLAVDENVGRVLDYLDETGLSDNTVVVYASDQGFFLGEHGWFDKRWIYEESLRTPMLMRWPGHIEPGSSTDEIVSVIDIAPTFLEMAGAPVPEDVQGRSFVPLLTGETPEDWRDSFYFHYYEYPGWHAVRKHYGVVEKRYKLAYFYEMDMQTWLLIDRIADPSEQTNFYGRPEYAQVTERLKAELERLRAELEVPDPDPPESYPIGEPF